eukprot:TRINITY_DN12431_c0_g1_i1.p2 TRINITY_DN12431_c0_g1~~TRINITY_DN12431_c0_g1_i1.p2  ORF type:complete len:230 (-),score=64.48 TRINITY_DN12431_c0_g1_i1:93-782(-)
MTARLLVRPKSKTNSRGEYNLVMASSRSIEMGDLQKSLLKMKLQNLQLISESKAKFSMETLMKNLSDAKLFFEKISDFFHLETTKNTLEIAKESLENIDLRWELDLGDCQFLMYDYDPHSQLSVEDPNRKEYLKINLAEINQRDSVTVRELEGRVIEAKFGLAASEAQKDELLNTIKFMREEAVQVKKQRDEEIAKHRREMESLEQQLIEAKMSLAEIYLDQGMKRSGK